MSATSTRRLQRLFKREGGLCYWCECPMVLGEAGVVTKSFPSLATVDHLRDRLNPTRYDDLARGEGHDDRVVCACYECNCWRGTKAVAGLTVWQLSERRMAVEAARKAQIRRAKAGKAERRLAAGRAHRMEQDIRAGVMRYPPLPPVEPDREASP